MRYMAAGYKVIAITDHVDYCNIATSTKAIVDFCRHWPKDSAIKVLPGVELTHVPPRQFASLAKYARAHGIKIIVAHGETTVEPVILQTNRAALKADIDILAHPGLITPEDALLAKKRGVFLELTSRKGHCDTNAHVAATALKVGARLILNNDSHAPEDIISPQALRNIGFKAGLNQGDISHLYNEVEQFLRKRGA